MSLKVSAAFILAVGAVSSSFAAPSVLGKWSGQFHFKVIGKLPPAQLKLIQAKATEMMKVQIMLTLKPDHTFSLKTSKTPPKAPPQNGNWTQSGSTVTLSVPNSPNSQPFTISGDGKSLTFSPKSSKMMSSSLILHR